VRARVLASVTCDITGREIVNQDADVFRRSDGHVLEAARARAAWRTKWSRSATFVARRADSA
jgi:hypothetical protein